MLRSLKHFNGETMFSFFVGIVYANVGEWFIHKYVLHGLGKKKDSIWSFHWSEHHRAARKNYMIDSAYGPQDQFEGVSTYTGLTPREKETFGLGTLAIIHLPLAIFCPWFVAGVWTSICAYYYVHSKSHQDHEWAHKWLPWHEDHHMGRDQDKNWCVTMPWTDWVMRTREKSK